MSEIFTKPTVGRIVHYVSYGSPKGEYVSKCVAAVVTQVNDAEGKRIGVVVLNPTGIFFNVDIDCDVDHAAGTWHWPERTDG